MKRFFKRFFWFCLLVTIAGGGLGYYYGLRPDNYQEFFGDLRQRYLIGSKSDEKQESKTKHTPEKPTSSINKGNSFVKIDRHARACPKSAAKDVASLATYLEKGTRTDLEKARSIYIWLAKNVSYDDDGYNSKSYGDLSPEGVLKSRRAVCSGFSALYQALGEEMGLEIKDVSGYAKGYGYVPGKRLSQTDHAWNLIQIDGEWRVFDATWGEGYGENVNGKLVSTKKFDEFWFNTDPYKAIFSHFPEDPSLTHVSPNLSLQVYEKFPVVQKGYFQIGFDGHKTYKSVRKKGYVDFPQAFDLESKIEVVEAPPYRDLRIGQPHLFRFHAPAASKIAIINAKNDWEFLRKEKAYFFFEYTPKITGELKVSVEFPAKEGTFRTLIVYKVIRGKVNS